MSVFVHAQGRKLPTQGGTVLRFVFKVAVLWSISKTETQNMTFLSHMPSPMLVYALDSI